MHDAVTRFDQGSGPPADAGPRRLRFRLVQYFVVLGGIVVLLGAIGLAYLTRAVSNEHLDSLAEQNNVALTQAFANAVWPDFQPFLAEAKDRSVEEIRADPRTAALRAASRALVVGTNVLKIKLYDVSGLTVFSTDPSQIGSDYSTNERFLKAMAGGTASKLELRETFGAFDGKLENIWVLSSYIPLRPGGAEGAIEGVAETYTNVTAFHARMQQTGLSLIVATVVTLLLVFAFLAVIVWYADRMVRRQHQYNVALAAQAALADAASKAKSEFLANMSHELRTPLNAILGFAEMIKSETLGAVSIPRYKEYAADIHSSGRHLLGIINDVLDLVQVETGRTRVTIGPVDIGAVACDVIRLMNHQAAAKSIALRFVADTAIYPIESDEGKIRQILFNLIANALKFTPAGGSVAVTVSQSSAPAATSIRVSDNGVGMRAEDVPVALASFGQVGNVLERSEQGIGLGLPLTKRVTELLQGSLEIESQPGVGTTIVITLPGHFIRPARVVAS